MHTLSGRWPFCQLLQQRTSVSPCRAELHTWDKHMWTVPFRSQCQLSGFWYRLAILMFTDNAHRDGSPKGDEQDSGTPALKASHEESQLPTWVSECKRARPEKREAWEGALSSSASPCQWVYIAPSCAHVCVCPSAVHSTLACLVLAHAPVIYFLHLLKPRGRGEPIVIGLPFQPSSSALRQPV